MFAFGPVAARISGCVAGRTRPDADVARLIVTPKNRTLSPVAKLFIDHARNVARPLAKGK
jgi:hypothetical protein